MRLLPPEQQRAINQYLVSRIPELGYTYKVDEGAVRVISGKEEGAFLWLTVNYLLGRFEAGRGFSLQDPSLLLKQKRFTRVSIEVWHSNLQVCIFPSQS